MATTKSIGCDIMKRAIAQMKQEIKRKRERVQAQSEQIEKLGLELKSLENELETDLAQLNAFEAFAPFAAGVLMAQLAGVDPQRITWLAIAFVALRLLHGVFYLTGTHRARSLVWFAGLGCVIALMVQAALRIV